MPDDKKQSLTEEQRADLKALADKVENALGEFNEALAAIGLPNELGGSCVSCPRESGGAICSSFVGDAASPFALCERDFCGHPLLNHAWPDLS